MSNAELIAEARTVAKHSAVSLPEHADCLRRLADALEASEAWAKELEKDRDASDRAFRALKDQSAACDVERLELREHIAELEAQVKELKCAQVFRISEMQELVEAQARVVELEAGIEWEYGVQMPSGELWYVTSNLDEAQAVAAEPPVDVVVRRRKEGPWQPVESEGE